MHPRLRKRIFRIRSDYSAKLPYFLNCFIFVQKKNKNNTIPAKAGISAPQGAHFRKIRAQSIALTRDEIPAFAGMGRGGDFPPPRRIFRRNAKFPTGHSCESRNPASFLPPTFRKKQDTGFRLGALRAFVASLGALGMTREDSGVRRNYWKRKFPPNLLNFRRYTSSSAGKPGVSISANAE